MPADFETFRSILFYCLPIIVLPITTFFLSKIVIFDGLQFDPTTSNVYSAIIAIIMLHINFGMFIYKAYSMDSSPKKPEKID